MRISYMIHDLPNYTAGPIINALRILPELVNRGHKIQVLCAYRKDFPNVKYLLKNGVNANTIKFKKTETIVKWILHNLNQFRPDIFVPNSSTPAGYAAKWAKEAGIATVITHRSNDRFNWGLAKMFGYGVKEWQTSGMVCVNRYLKEEVLEKTNIPVNISVIPSGVPIPRKFNKQDSNKALKIVYAGRIEQKQKRIWDIIHAYRNVCKYYDKIILTIIGEGKQKNKIKKYVKEINSESRIIVKDRLTGDEYQNELIKHDIIVLFSDYEGTPGSIMDGMACGLIPICVKIKGIDELVESYKTGILINDRNDEFIDSIGNLLNNRSLRIELSRNARNHIIKNYSLEKSVSMWESFLTELKSNSTNYIKIPNKVILPPVVPELSSEDQRIKRHDINLFNNIIIRLWKSYPKKPKIKDLR